MYKHDLVRTSAIKGGEREKLKAWKVDMDQGEKEGSEEERTLRSILEL